jgi:deazaflavin-dependent oxidoreductase (nitroreductase family)
MSAPRTMKQWMTRLHATVYRWSNGRLLGRMGGTPVLVLETTGRRTGRSRRTPVQYLAVDGAFVVVASNGGAPRPPAWCLNLRGQLHARVQVDARTMDVSAHEVRGEERTVLWRRLTASNRYLESAARRAGHELPLLKLTPTENPL